MTAEKSDNATDSSDQTRVKIHPDTFIHAQSTIRGRVTFDAGCVVHPNATIDAGDGEIVFSKNNIVEETALIENRLPGHKLLIGESNLFEIGSRFAGTSVGDNNILGQRSIVGENVELSNGCVIGPKCELREQKLLNERTCIYGENNERRVMQDSPPSLQKHTKFLCAKLIKFGHALRNTQK